MTRRRRQHLPRPVKMRLRHQHWIEIREPGTGRLLFKYDAQRRIIEVPRRRQKTLVNLGELDSAAD